jgi:hypothetical protein
LLKSKRTKQIRDASSREEHNTGCLNVAPSTVSLPEGRKPFGRITTNEIVKPKTPILTVTRPKVSWTLSEKLTITTNASIAPWKTQLGKSDCPMELTNLFDFYRFPFPALPDPRRLCNILAKKSDSLERQFFKSMVDSWRRALLSLYNGLKMGGTPYFYYLQSDLVVLFRNDGGKMKAFISKATKSLIDLLKEEGLEFEQLDEDKELCPEQDEMELEKTDHESSDQENIDPQLIKEAINRRINRARKTHSKRVSVASTTLSVSGEISVHGLVDFLLNQRDGKSFVVMPELVAPGPFLHGTLSRTDLSVVGPIHGGDYQISGTGMVLPTAAEALVDHVYTLNGGQSPFNLNAALDERTESFLPFHL